MIALITVTYWDEDARKFKDSYVAKSECESFSAAAQYAEQIYGDDLGTLKIELLDTALYLSEEIFQAIREDKYL